MIYVYSRPYATRSHYFFQVYKALEKKKTKVGDWHAKERAIQIIEEAFERYKANDNN